MANSGRQYETNWSRAAASNRVLQPMATESRPFDANFDSLDNTGSAAGGIRITGGRDGISATYSARAPTRGSIADTVGAKGRRATQRRQPLGISRRKESQRESPACHCHGHAGPVRVAGDRQGRHAGFRGADAGFRCCRRGHGDRGWGGDAIDRIVSHASGDCPRSAAGVGWHAGDTASTASRYLTDTSVASNRLLSLLEPARNQSRPALHVAVASFKGATADHQASFYRPRTGRFACTAITTPNPASNDTAAVPPKLSSGIGTPTTGRRPAIMPPLTTT
jgi:hypothetical protein